MCGICGFIHNRIVGENSLRDMNQTIHYRGPNDEGYYMCNLPYGRQLGFSHKRLSIIDLSALGHQPMLSSDGNIVLSYNGEIYNFQEIRSELIKVGYVFCSNCDTEVIIYAYQEWGIHCVEKMNGMFAFALYDKRTDEFYLVRDRMGVKPLYYYLDEKNNIVFSSELKPIMKYPYFSKNINMEALGLFLYHQYITGPYSIFEKVFKLEPGHYLRMSNGLIEVKEYWSIKETLTHRVSFFEGDYQQAISELKELLLDATKLRMISDVPLGGFLSGGYDSSLIVSLMKELSDKKIKTFTIGFQESQYDEAEYAAEVAKYLGTEHYCKYLSIHEAKRYINEISLYFDEPMADHSQIATMLLSKIAKEYVTVALSGDAGDELFCGYSSYNEYHKLERFKIISKTLCTMNHVFPIKNLFVRMGKRKFVKLFHLTGVEDIIHANFYTYQDMHKNILISDPSISYDKYYEATTFANEPQMKYMLKDMVTYLPDDILTKVDRASMSVSLETRSPFLDYRVVEFALSLPLEYKYRNNISKRILKDLSYSFVDKKLLDRPKQGFSVPTREWMYDDFDNFTKGLFDEAYIRKQGIFNDKVIKSMIYDFKNRNSIANSRELWTLLVFQNWYEMYMND
ncbi:MAG: asparagine synthase (glutamine-hydrolyzing) [Lachnospiraceae bacterium]|jgi:asparagine synthase (glutamine-hydrolysing)|nr:asparagine synthase (glutamine-hydrolyzing) [Lachnospiraceae bacterium]